MDDDDNMYTVGTVNDYPYLCEGRSAEHLAKGDLRFQDGGDLALGAT